MAYIWGDSFDCYAATTDLALGGYWDSAITGQTFVAGRFAGSQALRMANATTTTFIKSSPANDPVHHFSLAYKQNAALSGSTLGLHFQLSDGATNQCCIVFRSDGAILLTSATPGGTVLATYVGAVTAISTWYQFEIEVVINNVSGSFKVRKNGSATDDHSTTGINTRPGTNAYINRLTMSASGNVNDQNIDDFLWRSDASSVPWVGDIRCQMRMPVGNASVQFAVSPTSALQVVTGGTTGIGAIANGTVHAMPFVASSNGMLTGVTLSLASAATAHIKMALYDATRSILLATSSEITNPGVGVVNVTFPTPFAIVKGASYFLAYNQDASVSYNGTAQGAVASGTIAYASWPPASIATLGTGAVATSAMTATYILTNYHVVNETLQDALTSYVYDATPGHADLYTIAPIAAPPVSTVAVTVRALMQKSDAGTRVVTVQLKSGGTTVASPSNVLATSTWGWVYRTDTTDPNTSAAWTASGVAAAQIGPAVVS